MSRDQVDAILRKTLEDFRVSRGEKRVIQSILSEMNAGEHQLAVIRSQAFDIARELLLGPDAIGVLDWLEDVIRVLQPQTAPQPKNSAANAYFSPGGDCMRQIVSLLNRVRQSADICVFTITDDRISDAIVAGQQRRVDIRIITDNDKSLDLGSDIARLTRLGVPVRVDLTEYHMHHKFAIFDRRILLTGSYNWTRSAAERNEENMIVVNDESLTKKFSKVFQKLWDQLI